MVVTKPLIPIQAKWNAFKLYRDYPDRWDRYVRLKEIESETREMAKKQDIAIARSNFLGAFFRIDICWMLAIKTERPKEEHDKNAAEFQQARGDLIVAIKELERNGISISEELKSCLLKTPIDKFRTLEEWDVFTKGLNEKMKDF